VAERRRGGRAGLIVLAAALGALWIARRPILGGAGALLIAEDPVAPAAVVVVSNASARGDALEAARLYGTGLTRRIVVPPWTSDAVDDAVVALGVPYLRTTDLVLAILTRSGVPRDAIVVLPDPVDGLNAEVAAVARFARTDPPPSLRFVTERTHTRRARWLLHRALPASVEITVSSPPMDTFSPDTWWTTRENTRELTMEYLRWINTLLRDRWQRPPP
jgi:uncharacterized SAM-binding protein YcdF (DUF218 family)